MTAAPNLEHLSYDTPGRVYGICVKRRKNFHKAHRRPQGCGKTSREDSRLLGRLEHMLKLAVALVLLVALAGAATDLARGRRPALFA